MRARGRGLPGWGGGPGGGVGRRPGQRSGSCSAPTEVGQGTARRAERGHGAKRRPTVWPLTHREVHENDNVGCPRRRRGLDRPMHLPSVGCYVSGKRQTATAEAGRL